MRGRGFTHAVSDAPTSGGELSIVDNSDEAWKGLRHLRDRTALAIAFDIIHIVSSVHELLRTEFGHFAIGGPAAVHREEHHETQSPAFRLH